MVSGSISNSTNGAASQALSQHGETFPITHSIELDFFAGLSNQHFSETFYIIDPKVASGKPDPTGNTSITNDSAIGDFPVILLGGPFLKHSHALVTDPDFENPANPGYEVLVDPPPEPLSIIRLLRDLFGDRIRQETHGRL